MADSELDPSSGVPFYRQIKEILRSEILRGNISPEHPITEAKLLERFAVSRAPIRQALSELRSEGFVYRRQGKGTFPVAGPRIDRPTDLTAGGLQEYLTAQGANAHSMTRELARIPAPSHVCDDLGAPSGEKMLSFSRVILVDDTPLIDALVYVRAPESFTLSTTDLDSAGSIFPLLEQYLGVRIVSTDHDTWATSATERQAEVLVIPARTPLLAMKTIFRLADGSAIGWRLAMHRGDEFHYSFSERRQP